MCMSVRAYVIRMYVFIRCMYLWGMVRIGRHDAFRPEGRGFESRSSRRVGSLLYGPGASPSLRVASSASALKLTHSVNCCGRERF